MSRHNAVMKCMKRNEYLAVVFVQIQCKPVYVRVVNEGRVGWEGGRVGEWEGRLGEWEEGGG